MNSGSIVGVYSDGLNFEASENSGMFATVFQMEIVVIILTTREILKRNLNTKKIVICSDRQAAINALGYSTSTSKTVKECKEFPSKFTEICDLMMFWVPKHH